MGTEEVGKEPCDGDPIPELLRNPWGAHGFPRAMGTHSSVVCPDKHLYICRRVLHLGCAQPLWLPALEGALISRRLITPGDSQVSLLQLASVGLSHCGEAGLRSSSESLVPSGTARGVQPPVLILLWARGMLLGKFSHCRTSLVRGHQATGCVLHCILGKPGRWAG